MLLFKAPLCGVHEPVTDSLHIRKVIIHDLHNLRQQTVGRDDVVDLAPAFRGVIFHKLHIGVVAEDQKGANQFSVIALVGDPAILVHDQRHARQNRPLEPIYGVVFLDAIHYHVRSEGQVVKKAVYIAIGIDVDGRKDVLGMWVGENETAKYWATVLNSLKNRGLEDILIVCTDNLTGFSQAIEAVYPKTDIQNSIIHQLRNSSKYVSYKDLKELMADLKRVYAAVDEPSALDALEDFAGKWDKKYPKISKSWRDNWGQSEHLFQVSGGGPATDLHDQCHRGL